MDGGGRTVFLSSSVRHLEVGEIIQAWMCWKTDLQSLESKEAARVTWPEGGGGPGVLVGVGDARG